VLPNLIVIGAMKTGTSSLHSYLDCHPQISMSRPKELDFFVAEKNWPKGLDWYESHLPAIDGVQILGESSPNYTKCHVFAGVPGRMHSLVPEAKLIYLLRDPIERIVSHYVHNYSTERESESISRALKDLENNHYVLCSKYYMQLEPYLACFPRSNILIVTSGNLRNHRQQTLQRIFRFLDVDDTFCSQDFAQVLHRSSDKRRTSRVGSLLLRVPGRQRIKSLLPFLTRFAGLYRSLSLLRVRRPMIDERLRQRLADALIEDVERLRAYTGRSFEQWSV